MKSSLLFLGLITLVLAAPEPKKRKCVCEQRFCPQIWPQSCYCANNNLLLCYEECGGTYPTLAACPPLSSAVATPVSTPAPSSTAISCGGFRQSGGSCPDGYVCVDDPNNYGCGLACDQPGICASLDSFCGGFAGISCPKGQTCVDNPTDDCDPTNGGADCGGICV